MCPMHHDVLDASAGLVRACVLTCDRLLPQAWMTFEQTGTFCRLFRCQAPQDEECQRRDECGARTSCTTALLGNAMTELFVVRGYRLCRSMYACRPPAGSAWWVPRMQAACTRMSVAQKTPQNMQRFGFTTMTAMQHPKISAAEAASRFDSQLMPMVIAGLLQPLQTCARNHSCSSGVSKP